MRTLVPLVVLLAVAACDSTSTMKEGMTLLKGKPIDVAIRHLGPPAGIQDAGASRTYSWYDAHSSTLMREYTNEHSGTIQGYGDTYRYKGTSTSVAPETMHLSCKLYLVTTPRGIIFDGGWEGNHGSCQRFSGSLEAVIEDITGKPVSSTREATDFLGSALFYQ
jgi:hypothetical protein